MTYSPLLSVVMPVHNPGKYLRPCLDSVLNQTFRDFELIAIDDKSTDDSYMILQEYAGHETRMCVCANESNFGAARTRNRGLTMAQGEYIIFLDADDYFDSSYFEEMMNAILKSDSDVVISPVWWRDETTKKERLVPKNTYIIAKK